MVTTGSIIFVKAFSQKIISHFLCVLEESLFRVLLFIYLIHLCVSTSPIVLKNFKSCLQFLGTLISSFLVVSCLKQLHVIHVSKFENNDRTHLEGFCLFVCFINIALGIICNVCDRQRVPILNL